MGKIGLIIAGVLAIALGLAFVGWYFFIREQTPQNGFRDRMSDIAEMDTDGDGYVSYDEFEGPERMFDRADTDGDGFLDTDEIEEIRRRIEKRAESGERRPNRMRFEEMDANADSVLTADEFRGPTEAFDRMDTDGDGQITRQEMQDARPPRPDNGRDGQ